MRDLLRGCIERNQSPNGKSVIWFKDLPVINNVNYWLPANLGQSICIIKAPLSLLGHIGHASMAALAC